MKTNRSSKLRIPLFMVAGCAIVGCAANHHGTWVFETERVPVSVSTVVGNLDHPWGMAFVSDNELLVTERSGNLRIVRLDGTVSEPVTGIPEVWARGQGGLLDVAIAPDYQTTREVFISYAEPGDNGSAGTAVARGVLSEGKFEDVEVIFRQSQKMRSRVHFGSRLVFATDGTLFITTGDRGQRYDSQDLSGHLGKVIRINADGTTPPDNPFTARANAQPEIHSFGHRNLQGAALHPQTGQLWTVEHGARGGDEVNTPQAGKNYGWPIITYGVDYSGASIGIGTARAGLEQPVFYWDPSIAPSGLAFYTGDMFPEWNHNLFVGSLKFELLVRLQLQDGEVVHEERILDGIGDRIRDVEQGPDGALYLLTDDNNGRVLRVHRN